LQKPVDIDALTSIVRRGCESSRPSTAASA
jgi:hypothetical protein